ncbi:MAG: TonB-dependent receptor [bacterium]|nr:TonB-dependent receptor [bacterium]
MKSLFRVALGRTLLLVLILCSPLFAGTTGKIAGRVIDQKSGTPLPGVNVLVAGTALGGVTDLDGTYTILEVPPGTHSVQLSMLGYARVTVQSVRVLIDQTAHVDVRLAEEVLQGEAVVVAAKRELVKTDVATSVVSVSDREIQDLPVANIEGVLGMQAGMQGLSIRGGMADAALFMMDGVTLRDPRNNQPITKLALSAIKEISVERGGFNAEYGQVQSGLVNVVTQEGSRQGYFGSVQTRLSPAAPKYWRGRGIVDVHDPNSYVMRPFYDDAVCWTGTANGAWDEYTRKQYMEFVGWNEISRSLCSDNNPDNDLTPLAARRAFEYETRKRQINDRPDYDIDAGFGGPVPVIGEALGGLRFFGSFRQHRDMLLWPLSRPDYRDYDWTFQLNADITKTMKLRLSALAGKQFTIRHNWDGTGTYYYPRYPNEIAGVALNVASTFDLVNMFSDYNFCLADIGHRSLAAKLTHTISPKTFYEVSLEQFRRDYNVRPRALRDTSALTEVVPGFYEDSNPLGYWPLEVNGVIIIGGSHVAKARDFTRVGSTTLKADYTSQADYHNLVKAGAELVYNDLDFDYGTIASATAGKTYANRVQMRVFPVRAGLYLQDKLETKGFTMNAGLRLDYSDSRTDWWNVESYDNAFYSSKYKPSAEYPMKKSKPQWQLSPRLGISHPITENSKLFFNYGHFKQMPQYETLFRVQRNAERYLTSIGDPSLILAKTISYELGYDHLLPRNFLLQVTAFYRDISDQQDYTTYYSVAGYSYGLTTSNRYEDVRGFELTLRKGAGRWWSGFANYTYQVSTSGHFNSDERYEDPSEQKKYDEATINMYQDRPIPRPYARADLSLYSPQDLGPSVLGHAPLGGWMLNVLLNWQAGNWVTWNPRNVPSISYNVRTLDYFNATLRLSKTLRLGRASLQLMMDVDNVLDTKRLWDTGDRDYMLSLHLPKNKAYNNIPGNDRVGDYRKPGVEFQPMEYQGTIDPAQAGKPRAIYYEGSTGRYWEYAGGAWSEVAKKRIDRVLRDKAYIDMPNASTFWFLNPRHFYYGARLSFDLTR